MTSLEWSAGQDGRDDNAMGSNVSAPRRMLFDEPELSLDSAWVFSLSGAKVLSSAALEYARYHNIALCANSTKNKNV